jgi:hypothetical protein
MGRVEKWWYTSSSVKNKIKNNTNAEQHADYTILQTTSLIDKNRINFS